MKFLTLSALFLGLANASLYAAPIIEHIAPNSAKACPTDNKDCRTAKQAAPYIAQGMYRYGVYSVKEIAAVISLMAFESGDFRYKRNMFPGRPGQGTANMQMANYNLLYAKCIPGVKEHFEGVDSVDGMSDDEKNDLLDLVTVDKYNFASGPWFLTTQCDASVRKALDDDIDDGFAAYMKCIDVEVTDDRLAYFNRAKEAFGLTS
ncbi:hypothetical protein NM208_g17256 [Fusarium decemcellulare]|uniref:Uncharacterized protein n=1 Tax=Fusarium decemcellulare TaxID=57161 RepID=A0ACC1R9R4_9HYPO|nr:hypothetical protein NM208_g17256 [Fusarium decemcellulare]